MSEIDAIFAEINSIPMTAKIPVRFNGKNLKGTNELPLITQAAANAVATVAWSISSPRGQQNIQRTIETSIKRKFFPYVNALARGNRKSLHHVYEWEKVGVTSARLFDLRIPSNSRGRANFTMRVDFRPSKTLVPLTTAQATPNPDTGEVVKRQHVFWNKAMVMEYGMTVVVRPLGRSKMAFDNTSSAHGVLGADWSKSTKSGLTFTSRPVKIDYSKRETFSGLQMAMKGFFPVGQKEAGNSVRRYARIAARGARKSSHMINISMPSDAYANAVAKKITDSLVVTE
jgi:hypothetical protein